MIYINDEAFKDKVLIDMSLEKLWESLFEDSSKEKEFVFRKLINDKIINKKDAFFKKLLDEESNPESCFYQTSIANNFLNAYNWNVLYNFFRVEGIKIFPIFFIDSNRIHKEVENIKIDMENLKDFLTIEEYENLIMEELIYNLENFAVLKKEEIKVIMK